MRKGGGLGVQEPEAQRGVGLGSPRCSASRGESVCGAFNLVCKVGSALPNVETRRRSCRPRREEGDEGEDELRELRLKIKQALLNAHINMETNRSAGELSSGRLSGCSSMELSLEETASTTSMASTEGGSRRLSFER